VIRLVRTGNSCQILEAMHHDENRRVALKVLQKEFRKDKEEINYLKHEHMIGKDLKHPQVIEIYEIYFDYDLPFLALEFFRGKNIKQLLRNDPELITKHIGSVIEQCAEGLEHLHGHGWVHRDVKPDNFLLDDDGNVKLIDFALAQKHVTGLAKLFAWGGKVQGTRSYMSPEQIQGKHVDPRADIYSLGCMIFELLSGRLPYTGVNENELLNKHIKAGVPSVIPYNNDISPELGALIAQMMAKDPNERPRSMKRFLQKFRDCRIYRAKQS